jgi:hypothetical protein
MPTSNTSDHGAEHAALPRRGGAVTCTISNLTDLASEDVERSLLALCDDLAALSLARYLAEEEEEEEGDDDDDADADADQGRDLRPLLDGPAGR